MSDGIVGTAKFQCSHCGVDYELSSNDLYFESTGGSERSMGEEIEYNAHVSENCYRCGSLYQIDLIVWEYPIGIINYTDESSKGVDYLDVTYDVYHCPPEPEPDSSRVMGAAAGGAIFGASIGGPFGAILGGIIGGIIGDSIAKGDKSG